MNPASNAVCYTNAGKLHNDTLITAIGEAGDSWDVFHFD